MERNVGKTDKTIRIVVGVVIIAIGIVAKSWWGLVGVVPLATAFINYCPLYSIMGINTSSENKQ